MKYFHYLLKQQCDNLTNYYDIISNLYHFNFLFLLINLIFLFLSNFSFICFSCVRHFFSFLFLHFLFAYVFFYFLLMLILYMLILRLRGFVSQDTNKTTHTFSFSFSLSVFLMKWLILEFFGERKIGWRTWLLRSGEKWYVEDGGTGNFLAICVAERDNSQLFRFRRMDAAPKVRRQLAHTERAPSCIWKNARRKTRARSRRIY